MGHVSEDSQSVKSKEPIDRDNRYMHSKWLMRSATVLSVGVTASVVSRTGTLHWL